MDPASDTSGPAQHAAVNLAQWDERVPAHAASPDYHFAEFVADPST